MNTLKQQLEDLVGQPDSPFYKVVQDGIEIYSHRLATYSDFLQPAALEARGIAFLGDQCVARPPMKFFNWQENPFTALSMEQVLDEADQIRLKEDGSLITTLNSGTY